MKQSEIDSLRPGDLVVFRPKDPEDYKFYKLPFLNSVKGSLLRLGRVLEFGASKKYLFYVDDPGVYSVIENSETDLLSGEWSLEASSQAKKLFDKELEELLNE